MNKVKPRYTANEDVYEVFVDGSYYGTIKRKADAPLEKVINRIKKVFPKLRNKQPNVDYKIKYIQSVTYPITREMYYYHRNKED